MLPNHCETEADFSDNHQILRRSITAPLWDVLVFSLKTSTFTLPQQTSLHLPCGHAENICQVPRRGMTFLVVWSNKQKVKLKTSTAEQETLDVTKLGFPQQPFLCLCLDVWLTLVIYRHRRQRNLHPGLSQFSCPKPWWHLFTVIYQTHLEVSLHLPWGQFTTNYLLKKSSSKDKFVAPWANTRD